MIRIINKIESIKLTDDTFDDVTREVEYLIMFLHYMLTELGCATIGEQYRQAVNAELLAVPIEYRAFEVDHVLPGHLGSTLPTKLLLDNRAYKRHDIEYAFPYFNMRDKGLYADWSKFQAWFNANKAAIYLNEKDHWQGIAGKLLDSDVFITDFWLEPTNLFRRYIIQFATEITESD